MKTRSDLYGQEAASLLRDISMYRALTEEQLLRLYPGKRDKVKNLLAYLVKQNRIWYGDGLYCAAPDGPENIDRGLLAAVWVLADFIDRVEYHSVGDYPAKIIFFADGQVYEIVHAAHRGEKITTIFVNNAIYGMTGGQMAPTTLIGQKATTCPAGRSEEWSGLPIKMCEMLAAVPSSYYIERVAVNNTANIAKAKKAIAKAFRLQMEGKGFTMIEVLSTCPTNWGLSPVEAMNWLEQNMIPYYPLGVYKDKEAK